MSSLQLLDPGPELGQPGALAAIEIAVNLAHRLVDALHLGLGLRQRSTRLPGRIQLGGPDQALALVGPRLVVGQRPVQHRSIAQADLAALGQQRLPTRKGVTVGWRHGHVNSG